MHKRGGFVNISIKLEGIELIAAKLNSIAGGSALQNGLLQGGEIVRAEAQANCPVDTGRLRESIEVQSLDGTSVIIGPTAEYGVYVEFGTGSKGDPSVAHTAKKGWVYYNEKTGDFVYTTGQAPQPYLIPALYSQKDAVVDAIRQGLLSAF